MGASRFEITPSLLASVLLHLGIGLLLLIYWPRTPTPPPTFGSTVPVTIVTDGPPTVAPSEQALEVAPAATETPVPLAPPQPPTPIPSPELTPPAATPAAATKAKPTPAKPGAGAPPQADSFFVNTSKLLDAHNKGGAATSSAPKGPDRKPTSPNPKPGDAPASTGPPFADLAGPLMRLWNPNCQVEGGAQVKLTLTVRIGANGRLMDEPKVTKGMNDDPITQAAALRAKSAMRQVEPFPVPPGYVEQLVNFNFDAPAVCRSRH